MGNDYRLEDVGNSELLTALSELVQESNVLTGRLLAHLVELEQRMLHLELGYPSLFSYCVQLRRDTTSTLRRSRPTRELTRACDSGAASVGRQEAPRLRVAQRGILRCARVGDTGAAAGPAATFLGLAGKLARITTARMGRTGTRFARRAPIATVLVRAGVGVVPRVTARRRARASGIVAAPASGNAGEVGQQRAGRGRPRAVRDARAGATALAPAIGVTMRARDTIGIALTGVHANVPADAKAIRSERARAFFLARAVFAALLVCDVIVGTQVTSQSRRAIVGGFARGAHALCRR